MFKKHLQQTVSSGKTILERFLLHQQMLDNRWR